MLTKIASASVMALASTQAKDHWLHEKIYSQMEAVLDGKKIEDSAHDILADIHQGLQEKLQKSIE